MHKVVILGAVVSIITLISLGLYAYVDSTKQAAIGTQPPQSFYPSPSHSPVINKEMQYTIIEGSVFKVFPDGKQELFVSKTEVRHEQLDIKEINSFDFSPDRSKMLLFTYGGITPYLLFYKNITNNDVVYVGIGEEAKWSPNAQYIAFTNRPGDVGPLRLHVFDTGVNEWVETIESKKKGDISYNSFQWSADSNSIIVQYEIRDDIPYGNIIETGETKVTIKKD